MEEFGAKRGEWKISDYEYKREIIGRPNESVSTFSSTASAQRLNFNDRGKLYQIRLDELGRVMVREEGSSIENEVGYNNSFGEPVAFEFHEERLGKKLNSVPPFEMIAAGRGRLLAKVKGDDRIFHLKLDELFRTIGDKPVPSNFIKIDPNYFKLGDKSKSVPNELKGDYHNHPASVRFDLFNLMMSAGYETADFVVVPMKPNIWYEIDSRPPLNALDFNDYLHIELGDIKPILVDNDYENLHLLVQSSLNNQSGDLDPLIEDILFKLIEDAPLFGMVKTAIRLVNWFDSEEQIEEKARGVFKSFVDNNSEGNENTIVAYVASKVVEVVGEKLNDNDVDPLILLGWIAVNLQLLEISKPVDSNGNLIKDKDGVISYKAFELGFNTNDWRIRPQLLIDRLKDSDNSEMTRVLSKIIEKVRIREERLNPSIPPKNLPKYDHVHYQSKDGLHNVVRESIDVKQVMDLGVGYSHWNENWDASMAGEMHSLKATRPSFQQEGFNSIMYRFLNGPILDGDGYNDGTTNFYQLVKFNSKKDQQQYGILYIDEQTYFTQRWRLVHPTSDVKGDLFSQAKVLSEKPHYFRFNQDHYWDPFIAECVNDDSRMEVKRQSIVVTGNSTHRNGVKQPEIYTFNFNYGTSDYSWRWRKYPFAMVLNMPNKSLAEVKEALDEMITARVAAKKEKTVELISILPNPVLEKYSKYFEDLEFENKPSNDFIKLIELDGMVVSSTIGLREDLTIYMYGSKRINDNEEILGYWYQKLLPSDCQPVPHWTGLKGGKPNVGYSHDWKFMSEAAWNVASKEFHLGAYVGDYTSRAQYYSVDIVDPEIREIMDHQYLDGEIWSETDGGRLRHNTKNFSWDLSLKNNQGKLQGKDYTSITSSISFDQLICDRENDTTTISMYEDLTQFRILDRGKLGLILTYNDKRDDDMQAASHLPHPVNLKKLDISGVLKKIGNNFEASESTKVLTTPISESLVPLSWNNKITEAIASKLDPIKAKQIDELELLVKDHHWVSKPPSVMSAKCQWVSSDELAHLDFDLKEIDAMEIDGVNLDSIEGNKHYLKISFTTGCSDEEVLRTFWTLSLGAVFGEESKEVLKLNIQEQFQRASRLKTPLPTGATVEEASESQYEFVSLVSVNDDLKAILDNKFANEVAEKEGATFWFEGPTGLIGVADSNIFDL